MNRWYLDRLIEMNPDVIFYDQDKVEMLLYYLTPRLSVDQSSLEELKMHLEYFDEFYREFEKDNGAIA